MIRTAVVIVWTIFSTLVLGSLTLGVSLFYRKGRIQHLIARCWGRAILFVSGVSVTVKGLDRVNAEQAYLYMPNHQSMFDIPVLLGRLPVQFRWLAKAELFKIPIFGHGMRSCGYISIDRSNRKAAFASLERVADAIRDGVSVLIFPEGTRSHDGRLRSFKKGGFVVAVDAAVPIVPVVIHGTWPIMPKGHLRIKPGPVILDILDPVPTTGYTRKTKDALMTVIGDALGGRLAEYQKDPTRC
jgi:1-acyl-sn-glycerol-3-phosphate acyltransferase